MHCVYFDLHVEERNYVGEPPRNHQDEYRRLKNLLRSRFKRQLGIKCELTHRTFLTHDMQHNYNPNLMLFKINVEVAFKECAR